MIGCCDRSEELLTVAFLERIEKDVPQELAGEEDWRWNGDMRDHCPAEDRLEPDSGDETPVMCQSDSLAGNSLTGEMPGNPGNNFLPRDDLTHSTPPTSKT